MHISAPFIKRPVATFLLSIAILMAGAVAYKFLPVAALPQVEFPTISVNAGIPGSDPETTASAITTPLERQFSRIAGITQMTSVSGTGTASIILQFDLSRDINGAARDVQAAINAARAQLPANLPQNPSYRKINPADAPILMLALTSESMTSAQLYDVADSILSQKIAQVPGVGQVFAGGSAKPAVRIEANPRQLSAYGIGLEALRTAIGQINVLQPTGYLQDDEHRWEVSTSDQLFGAAAYAPLIIATDRGNVSSAAASTGLPSSVAAVSTTTSTTTNTANGPANNANRTPVAASNQSTSAAANAHGIVRIRDVATVYDGVENIQTGGFVDGKPAILMQVFKSPGANVIDTVDRVLALLPTLRATIPPAVTLQVAMDRTTTIRASVNDITRTLVLTICLVVLVVFFFLREVRSTLIPSVSVPLSLMGTFGVMYLLGYSLDNLSLMALTISTGFVVDDAIVVIENISRHLEAGMQPFEAAMLGSEEIGFTVLSMSISLIAVFIPILLMGGIVGRLFREFAVTLSVAILMSLVVSLTTTPMLSAKFLKAHDQQKHGRFYLWGEKFFNWMLKEYDRGLRWVIRHWVLTFLITVGTFILNIYLFILVPKGFFPQQDTGRVGGQIRAQQDTSFEAMRQKMITLAAIVQRDPAVEHVMSFVGGGGPGGGAFNTANLFLALKPYDERIKNGDTADVVINRLRPRLQGTPGAQLFMQSQQELNIGGRQSAAQFQYTVTADTVAELKEWGPKLQNAMARLPELRDINTDQQDNGLRYQLVIDRDTASRLGITPLMIDSTLSDAFGQRQVSTTYRTLNQYHVVMEVAPEFQTDLDSLRHIFVKSTNGTQVPLSAFSHFEMNRVPLQVNHQSQRPASTISFNLGPGVSLSDATNAIERVKNQIGLPSTVVGGFQGSAQAFQSSLSSEPILILLAMTTVYIVLGMLYESFIHPLTILSTLPSAGVGALLALLITNMELSVIAMIGMVLLIGIVKKNAIMMIDFAIAAEREHGKDSEGAIYEACLLRFRPIMMTTFAALLGGLPLALGTGTGSELRKPLGVTIVGGLLVSQCLTLFTTPAVYLFFDKLRKRLAKFFPKKAAAPAHVPHPATGD
ncbi:efflux RND transporter permease subunit [Terriglobus albidus]|uniref:efflux RND transporter permease subunit n=1 Tax=Terriglobus albidus TaxID=1592106 RepID=UPI0021DFDB2F|nr:efflux RND transporter permease subunit [Terriglobus albidus]